MLPPPGVRWGNALKFEAKINWIRFGSTLEWSQYRPRPRSPGRSKLDQEKWSSKGGHISEIISSENYWRNPPIKGHRSSIFIQKLFFCPFSISTGDEILSHCTQCPNLLFWIWKYFHSTVQKFKNCGHKLADNFTFQFIPLVSKHRSHSHLELSIDVGYRCRKVNFLQ